MKINKQRNLLNGVIDQSQEHSDGFYDIDEYAWQEFIPTGKNLLSVEVKICKSFIWPPDLILTIEKPLGTILSTASLPSQDIPWEICGWTNFDIPDIPLEKEQKYYIVLSHEPPNRQYKWSGAWNNHYPEGESNKESQWDWCFRTIVDKSKESNNKIANKHPIFNYLSIENNLFLRNILKLVHL